jgi:signal transduction histidine kinase
VASVSHELRTPLTAIVGYLTLLDDNGDEFPEDARREMISEATGEARHMSRLVNDLVMLARGSSTHLPLEIAEVPMSSIVTSALRNVDADGTRIDEELAQDANVRVDADRVQQALTNLLSNAVRYGGDEIILDTKLEERDLVVEVHDNGPGVPTRYQTNIWNRFERGAHRLNAAAPGLGIGLAIVKAVAVSHGGSAHYVDSERLGGACFTLVLPGCVASDEPASQPIEVPSNR